MEEFANGTRCQGLLYPSFWVCTWNRYNTAFRYSVCRGMVPLYIERSWTYCRCSLIFDSLTYANHTYLPTYWQITTHVNHRPPLAHPPIHLISIIHVYFAIFFHSFFFQNLSSGKQRIHSSASSCINLQLSFRLSLHERSLPLSTRKATADVAAIGILCWFTILLFHYFVSSRPSQ